MNRYEAHKLCKDTLIQHGLSDWGVRISTDDKFSQVLGMCIYKDKVIVLNAHHVDIHPDDEIKDTILHEVAHALCPGHGHDDVWSAKAREIGCTNTLPCSHLDLPEHVIDAIRSGQMVDIEVEEEVHVIRKPKYTITRLQDKCPDCGKVAVEKFSFESIDVKTGDTIRLVTLECFHIIKKIIPRGTPFETMVSNDWNEEVKNCKHDWDKNRCKKCGEFKLFNFQITGARLAEAGLATQKGFGIFDEMGLGKTVQALALIKFHPDEYTPTLYVVKSAIKFNWFKEIIRWLSPSHLPQIISTSKDYLYPGLKSYVIAYDLLRRFPQEKLLALGIKLVVLDECQQIKNPDSSRTQAVRKIVGSSPTIKVIPLSGTPWKNRGEEFFPVLNMMDPIRFHSHQHYLENWVEYYYEGSKRKMGGIKSPKKFREYTQNLLVRREYDEVMDEFPDVNRTKLPVQLDQLSQNAYDDSESEFVKWYNQFIIGGEEESVNNIEILAQMARMRHITGLAKIPATLTFVEDFIEETDKKLVIFVHHKDVGQIMIDSLTGKNNDFKELAELVKEHGITIYKLTAEFSDAERFTIAEEFNKSKRAIMVASTLASGEGVNLQSCADSILHERQWNPQNEDQATPGRFKRIGQQSAVINITVPEAEGTVDEDIAIIVERKRRQFHETMNKSEMPTWNQGDFARELADKIVKRHQAKNKNKITNTKSITEMATLVKR